MSSSYAKPLEDKHFAIPEDIDVIYLIGSMHLNFLAEYVEKGKLVIVESDLANIASLKRDEELITHSNVHLFYNTCDKEEMAQKLSYEFPSEKIEVYGDDTFREALLRHSTIAFTSHAEKIHRHKLLINLIPNYRKINGSFDAGLLDMEGVPAIICGAGPSLDKEALLPFDTKALILGGGSTIAVMQEQLHLALAFDPNEEEYHRLKQCEGLCVPLIYGARLQKDVLDLFHGPRGYMRTGTGGPVDFWLEEQLELSPYLQKLDFGREALSVTTMAIALAASIGCSPIILYGCDLALKDGAEYASGIDVKSRGFGERLTQKNGLVTKTKWILEAKAIADYALRHSEVEWINATDGGLDIEGIKRQSLKTLSLPERGSIRNMLEQQMKYISCDVETPLGELKKSLERCKTYFPLSPGREALLEDEIAYKLLPESADIIDQMIQAW